MAGPSGQRTAQGAKAAQADAPASKAALGSNDFGRLYNLVGSLCGAEPEAKQRMLEQLGPSQRCGTALNPHVCGSAAGAPEVERCARVNHPGWLEGIGTGGVLQVQGRAGPGLKTQGLG